MSRPIRVLELRSVRGTGGGPEKTILLGAARSDSQRFAVTVCYLRDERDDVFGIDAAAAKLPIEYVEIREKHSFDISILTRLRRLIRERQIDIVHSHDYKTNLLAWILAQLERIVPMSTVHGWTGTSRRELLFYYPGDKRVLARFPALVAVSNEIRDELIRHGARPQRVQTLLNGIDHRRFRRVPERTAAMRAALGLAPDDVVIGAVGRLEHQKRFDLLLEAVARLRNEWPKLRLMLVGDGSLRQALEAQVAQLRLTPQCLLLGHRTDVADLHHAMDLFVQSSEYEGTPNAVLEAMALETPVIATDVGGTAELVRDGQDGLIVGARSAELLADAVHFMLAHPERAQEMAFNARRQVETVLSFDARMDALEAIYTSLYQGRFGHSAQPATVPS
jgi:glycosyltransferase involved in cell wall biosynthesis